MLQDCSLVLILAIEIANCYSKLPVVYLPAESYYQNPPKLPRLLLPDQKFSFPSVCTTLPNWEDVGLSLKILTEMTEPKHETSAFTSLINLIKFILVKEEMTCDNISTIQEQKPTGKRITNAVSTLDNSQIIAKIEAALAKPRRAPKKIAIVEFHDNIDVPNMIPILRPRGNSTRKRNKSNIAVPVTKQNSTTCQPKTTGLTVVGVKPITTVSGPNMPCLTKCSPLRVNLNPVSLPVQCQPFQKTPNVKPTVLGCENCNICQKLTSVPLVANCQKLTTLPLVANCQKLTVPLLGCQTLSNSVLTGCQNLNSVLTRPQTKNTFSVLQSETIPLMNCYGNMLRKVTTTILVPYCLSKLGI